MGYPIYGHYKISFRCSAKGLTEQRPEQPPGDFAPRPDSGRREKRKRTGSERSEVDRRDVISRVMNEVTDETSEKAAATAVSRPSGASLTCHFCLLSPLVNRDSRKTKPRRCHAQHVPSSSRLINVLYDSRRAKFGYLRIRLSSRRRFKIV